MDDNTDLLAASDLFYDDYHDMPALMDMSDSESDDASNWASDDDVPDLVSVDKLEARNAEDCRIARLKKIVPQLTSIPSFGLKMSPSTYNLACVYDMNFRLRRPTGTPAVLMLACPACDIDRPGVSVHEGNVFRRSERPTGEYLEWEACAPRLERARARVKADRYLEEVKIIGEEMLGASYVQAGWRHPDGEGPERMWALCAPLPVSTRAIVPPFVRAKL
ncbi:hypothetical protein C8R47DRAFT_1225515 [Mycena vitilis]|nr:hypothetical protein C8R47DRAFT_1225515 [Mycena vitilis]